MRFGVHGRSLALGLVLGGAAVAGLGAAQAERDPAAGRFELVVEGEGNVFAYVLDTATGQVWKESTSGNMLIRNDSFAKAKLGAAE